MSKFTAGQRVRVRRDTMAYRALKQAGFPPAGVVVDVGEARVMLSIAVDSNEDFALVLHFSDSELEETE